MAKFILIDEIHLQFFVPINQSNADSARVRRSLLGKAFLSNLNRTLCRVCKRFPALKAVRVRVMR